MSAAVALLREAATVGVSVRIVEGKVKVEGRPNPELLARLRETKVEIVALLRGFRCRWCGEPMAWPAACGVVEATGTALHHTCYHASEVARLRAAAERIVNSPDALADDAELMLVHGALA